MLYFAYGSCMNEKDFRRTCPHAIRVSSDARTLNFRLRFNGHSVSRGGGVANIEACEGSVVCGVLWYVDEEESKHLDRREGAPRVYRRERLTVVTPTGIVAAYTYMLVAPYPFDIAPSPSYQKLILNAISNEEYLRKVKVLFKKISEEEKEDVERSRTFGKRRTFQSLEKAFF